MTPQRGVPLAALAMVATLMGASAQAPVSLPSVHPAGACNFPVHVTGAGWDFCWQQDDLRGQGLELNQVLFHGEAVLWKIGFPFSITRYEGDAYGPFKDTLGKGYFGNPGFGIGSMQIHPADCPRFLGAGVLLNDRRICVETRAGPEPQVSIWARYDIFNYRFLQGYHLDSRGNLEPFVRLGGMLLDGMGGGSLDHFHHLYWRADFDIAAPGNDTFATFLRPDPEWKPFGPHGDLPRPCRQQIRNETTGWCPMGAETAVVNHPALFTRWRVADAATNLAGRLRSYEATVHSDGTVDGNFTTFDAMALQYKGDSQEIGFEVPLVPLLGDSYVHAYRDPAESIDDPVVWFSVHVLHDPRDEEAPTMSYHHASFDIRPRDFLFRNPGEDSFNPRALPGPGSTPGPITIGHIPV